MPCVDAQQLNDVVILCGDNVLNLGCDRSTRGYRSWMGAMGRAQFAFALL
jgi:hypothetical protein